MATNAPWFRMHGHPPAELSTRPPIQLLHPGYLCEEDTRSSCFVTFPRADRSSEGTFGVHHRTALLACQIIANNAFSGSYLALDREGQQRATTDLDAVLVGEAYYFIADPANPAEQYPIVPSFQDWRFPTTIPEIWPDVTPRVEHVDTNRCAITNFSYPLGNARLIPTREREWHLQNSWALYGMRRSNIHGAANCLRLRADLHKLFDTRGFVIVPKPDETNRLQYVTQVITVEKTEFWPEYHDVIVQHLHENSRALLLAHFAWAIFLQVKYFAISGWVPRRVVWRTVNTGEDGEVTRGPEVTTQLAKPGELDSLYGGGGQNDSKPLPKRKRGSADDDSDDSDEASDEDEKIYSTWEWPQAKRMKSQYSRGYH